MKIQYYIKNVYGNTNRYIKDPVLADAIRVLTGQKTVSEAQMKALETLGHSFEQVLPE